MDIRHILTELRRERDRIDQAIVVIKSLNSAGRWFGRRGRRGGPVQGAAVKPIRGRRHLSAAARKKLSAMMKARWASGKMGKRKTKAA